jgi:hypothetical protein
MGKPWVGLTVVFLFVLAIRLYSAFHTPFLSSDDAYLEVRSVESILHGNVLWNDPLGYGGRTLIRSPVFDAILAFFGLFMPLPLVFKIIPNIFASLLVIPAYLISHLLTKHKLFSEFTALITSLVPAYFAHTFNHISSLTLAIPLFFFLTYAWLKCPERKWIIAFLSVLLLFVFTHPLSIVFVLSIGMYIILLQLEKLKPRIAEYELGLFAIFFVLWAQFLMYKKLILFHGPAVIWQNVPGELLIQYFSEITILGALWQIGVFPLIGGTYALYKASFIDPQRETLILLSITLVAKIMLWFKLINIYMGLMLLGISLAFLFAKWVLFFSDWLKQTKIAKATWMFTTIAIVLAVYTTAYPTYTEVTSQLEHTITQEEVTALEILSKTTPVDSSIIAPVSYGNYVTAFANRKNVIDDYFYLQPRINERYQDVMRVYKTTFETEAAELFDKYSADYLIVPPGMKDLPYANSQCFKRIQATNVRIYEKDPSCKVRVVS